MVARPDGCGTIQRDLDGLEKWVSRNPAELNEGGITPHLGRNDPGHQHMLQSSFAEKATGVPLGIGFTVSHQHALVAKPANGHLGTLGRAAGSAQPW